MSQAGQCFFGAISPSTRHRGVVTSESGGIIEWTNQPGIQMLDAFIIQKIRRQEDLAHGEQRPLRIEISQGRHEDEVVQAETEHKDERGIAIIDFSV